LKRMMMLVALLAGLAVAAGAEAWKLAEAGTAFVSKGGAYSVQYPSGWRYDNSGVYSYSTLDGPRLNLLDVEYRKHKTAFKAIKKASSETQLPQDLAEDVLATIKAERKLENMEVLSNEPAELGGLPAFRLHVAYRQPVDQGTVRYQEIITGAVNAKGLYLVSYRGPAIHYFARNVPVYDETVRTFAFVTAPPKK